MVCTVLVKDHMTFGSMYLHPRIIQAHSFPAFIGVEVVGSNVLLVNQRRTKQI